MGNKGNSLIIACFALVLLTVIGLSIGKLTSSVLRGKNRLDTKLAFEDQLATLIAGVSRQIDSLARGSCQAGGPSGFLTQFTSVSFPGLGEAGLAPDRLSSWLSDANLTATLPPNWSTALKQCTDQSPSLPVDGETPAGYFFCLAFSRSEDSDSKNAFFDSDQIFAQVRVTLVDLSNPHLIYSGPFLSCNNYQANPNAGLLFYYRVFWHQPNDAQGFFDRKGTAVLPKPT